MSAKLEAVSKEVHNQWMVWAKELLENEPNISEERQLHWQKECFYDYEDLTEDMKDLDRSFARKIIKVLEEHGD